MPLLRVISTTCVFSSKKETYKLWEEKAKANRDTTLYREKTPTQRRRKNMAKVWNPRLHGIFDILTTQTLHWVSSLTIIVGILRMCVYSYHAWWRSNKIRINFLTKTESEKIKRINEGTLTLIWGSWVQVPYRATSFFITFQGYVLISFCLINDWCIIWTTQRRVLYESH